MSGAGRPLTGQRRNSPGPWRSPLTDHVKTAAMGVATDVADRLRSPGRIEKAAAAAIAQTGFPEFGRWVPYSLAEGDAGLAVMSGYLDQCFPAEGWDTTGHDQLAAAARAVEQKGCPSLGLFGGLSGLAYAALTLSRNGTRYRRLLTRIDHSLLPQMHTLACESRAHRTGMAVSIFDLISGLTGIGAYLLGRGEQTRDFDAPAAVIRALMAITAGESSLPRWYTPPGLNADPAQVRHQPYGSLNCGLAHGIPGPLSLMALALSAGLTIKGLDERVAQLANWLIAQRLENNWGITWPSMITLNSDGRSSSAIPSRTAWCYGSPGVARSLWLAGMALGNKNLCDTAIEAMACVYRTPHTERGVDSPTLCHGLAGLLQITLRFAHDTNDVLFTEAAKQLVEEILSAFEPDTIVGMRDIEPDGRRVERAGLLTGASGVALTLLAAATDIEPTWDRAFLLS
jgi:lantibiotic modifying enzyme